MRRVYGAEEKAQAVKLVGEIGLTKASRDLGIAPNTLRRWSDPDFAAKENAANAMRRRVPCDICGKPTSKYGRRHPEYGYLCHEHVTQLLGDKNRGYAVDELASMHQDEQLSTNEIAHRTGISQNAVHALLTRHGYEVRSRKEAADLRGAGAQYRGKVDPEEVYRLKGEGLSMPKIASQLGVSVSTVRYHLKRKEQTA